MSIQLLKRQLLLLLTIIALGIYMTIPVYDPDLGWHITIGRWISAHHEFPTEDLWTVIGKGKHWIAYSWLIEILLAFVESQFGQFGLMVLTVSLLAALALSLITLYSSVSKNTFRGYFLGIMVMFSFVNHFTLRPQSFTWMYFAFSLLAASKLREQWSLIRTFILALIFTLWSNTHISASVGLFAVFCILAEEVFLSPAPHITRKQFAITLGISLFATLLTPYYGEEWIVSYITSSHPAIFTTIREFAPANILQYCSAFLLLEIVLIATLAFQSRKPHKLLIVGCYAVLVLAGLIVVKFVPLALIFGGFLIADTLATSAEEKTSHLLEGFNKLEMLVKKIPFVVGYLICIVSAVHNWGLFTKDAKENWYFPVKAMDFFIEHSLPFPLLNAFADGGYIMWRLADNGGDIEHPVILDGRTNLYGKDQWFTLLNAHTGKPDWKKYIETYNPKTILWPEDSPFATLVSESPEWCEIYSDTTRNGIYKLFLRRDLFDQQKEHFSPKCSR